MKTVNCYRINCKHMYASFCELDEITIDEHKRCADFESKNIDFDLLNEDIKKRIAKLVDKYPKTRKDLFTKMYKVLIDEYKVNPYGVHKYGSILNTCIHNGWGEYLAEILSKFEKGEYIS